MRYVYLSALPILLALPCLALAQVEPVTVEGEVVEVNAPISSLRFRPKGGDLRTLQVIGRTKITYAGKVVALRGVPDGSFAKVTYNPESRLVLALHATAKPLSDGAAAAARMEQIGAELRPLRAKLAALERELATLMLKGAVLIDLEPSRLRIGVVGPLGQGAEPWAFRVVAVVDAKQMVLSLPRAPGPPFVVRGVATAGLVDGGEVRLPGIWRVSGTDRVGGRTLFVVEPFGAPPKK